MKSFALCAALCVSSAFGTIALNDPELDTIEWDKIQLKTYNNCNLDHVPEFTAFFKEDSANYKDLLVHVYDEAPAIFFLNKGQIVDKINVGNWDRPALHALMADLGLKRDINRTYDSIQKEKKLA